MGKVILVTSCKGGVGKSTVSANLAVAMSELFCPVCIKNSFSADITANNKKILLIDCDFGVRSLDLMLGVEDTNIYDLNDVISGKVALEDAVRIVDNRDNLHLLAAPMNYVSSEFEVDKFYELIEKVKDEYEFIIFDSAPAHAESFYITQKICDSALIITSSSACSLRAASKTAAELQKLGTDDVRLVMNMFEPKKILNDEYSGIMKSIETANTQLIGIIPYDRNIAIRQEKGLPVDFKKDKICKSAFIDLAQRVIGFNVPLPEKILGVKIKRLF